MPPINEPMVATQGQIQIIWWIICGLSAVFGTLLSGSFVYHTTQLKEALKTLNEERDAIWARINKHSEDVGESKLDAERRYATKQDVEKVRTDVLDRIDQSDKFMGEKLRRIIAEEIARRP